MSSNPAVRAALISRVSRVLRALPLACAIVLAVASSACTTGGYLVQAACGQLDIAMRARDIDGAARDPRVDPRTRALLAMVPEIKRFGESNSLRATTNYRRYADLERPAVVWVTTASEPLRFRSKTWWFPVVGQVPYLGWFDRNDASDFAAQLRDEGWDSDVGASDAYSTLGWFDDPVLSTMIAHGDDAVGELVNVILHESVHATLYIDGQTRFNESLAEFSSGRMTLAYLDRRFGPASPEKLAYVDGERRAILRAKRMHEAYETLDALYKSSRPAREKLAEKERLLVDLRAEMGYRRPINNATLAAFKNYNSGGNDLGALLTTCGGSWERFFAALRTLRKPGSFQTVNQADFTPALLPLISRGCV